MRNELSKATSGRSRAPLFPVRKTVLGSRRVRVYGDYLCTAKTKAKNESTCRQIFEKNGRVQDQCGIEGAGGFALISE
jgi:hypothetical protein